MLKKILILMLIVFIIILIALGIIDNSYCKDNTHRGVFPVNPYCTKCNGRDGVALHECTNPNGMDIYCRVCGRKVID